MRRCVFTFRSTEVELLLTRDPTSQEWLALMKWHLDEAPEPVVQPMAPQEPAVDEHDAWAAALDWASQSIDKAWLAHTGAMRC